MKNLIAILFLVHCNLFSQGKLLLRHPAINKDGSLISFSYQGDIWTVAAKGGKANRLTIHEAYEGNPIFSPDGNKIAFSGARFGNNDVFVIPTIGGLSKRLTFHSGGDQVASWSKANKILFSANREFRQIERPSEIYAISADGGTESRVMDAVGHEPAMSPDGRFIAFVRGDINPVAREDYDGTSNRELWIYDTKNKKYNLIPAFKTNDISPQWSGNNTLYFLSSESGTYNLYSIKLTTEGTTNGKPTKLTNYKDEAIRAYSVSGDGSAIVFEKDMNFYTMSTKGGSPQLLKIEINADERLDPTESKSFSDNATEYAVAPNGKAMAFAVRGEIFVKEVDKEKSNSVNISQHPYRDQDPTLMNDTTILFTSDRANGNFDIYLYRSIDTSQKNIVKTLKHEVVRMTNTPEDETALSVSPDGKKMVYVRGKGTLVSVDIDSTGAMKNEKILSESWDAPSDMTWSPDSKWLAYSQSDLYYNEEVFIHAADNSSKPVNISMHPRGDSGPVWSPDGSKLGFLSRRSTNRNANVWFVWLKKEDWEKASQDWQDKDTPSDISTTKGSKEKGVKPIKIDFENIHQRIVQVTNFPGNASNLAISQDGETFYYTTSNSNATRGSDLYSIKWDGKDLKDLTKGGTNPFNVTIDREGKYLYYARQNGGMSRIDAKSGTSESLPYLAKLKIDYIAERTQVFEEAWRTIRDGFYDPQFHGYDWNMLGEKYRERCVYASTSTDFRDMFNLLLGEINSSHMGLSVADRVETQREATGLLGVEIIPVAGGVKVNHIVPETPADKEKSKLKIGEIITAVNGEAVSDNENFHALLNGLANEKILLSVKDVENKIREVTIRPTSNISDNLYQEWVDNRKKLVNEYSKGRLGYLHIRGMDFPSFEETEREFTAAGYGKDGLIIDVRYNGGGSTADFLMTMLNYKQHAYTIPRGASQDIEKDKLKFRAYYPVGERLVYAAWMKPSIALCNEGSYSNAEIFSHAYKALGIGKLVGVPTNGSVISTGGKGLMDGSFVRLPLRGWFNITTNKNQELGAAIPDIIVENEPDWIAKGTDQQLKVAVDELLKTLK
jgi:tricorn protease